MAEIYQAYQRRDGRGKAAYHPEMMVRVLLYCYATGVRSSRRIERASYEDVAVRYLSADQHPDHDTIAAFRREHLEALSKLFVEVLALCWKAGLVKLGQVAIDGTKMEANAGKRRNVAYGSLSEREREWAAQVAELTTADAGYWNEWELQRLVDRGCGLLVAPERVGRRTANARQGPLARRMRQRLATEEGLRQYQQRQASVEPVFGWIKSVLGYRKFLLRGLAGVRGEWSLICTAVNLRRLSRLLPAAVGG